MGEEPKILKSSSGRVYWTKELHNIFLNAVTKLGPNASPATILREMKIKGLNRKQVGSHWQKFKRDSLENVNDFMFISFHHDSTEFYINNDNSSECDHWSSFSTSPSDEVFSSHRITWGMDVAVCGSRESESASTFCAVQTDIN
jgi:SHAQKYF class myb-like DNA-binding protein